MDLQAKIKTTDFFSKDEISGVWSAFKKQGVAHAKKPATKKRWDDVVAKKGDGKKNEEKAQILNLWLGRGHGWEEQMMVVTETIEESTKNIDDLKSFFPGELKRKHGMVEFTRLVKNGTFKEVTDKAGNTKYQKLTESQRKSVEHKKSLSTTQSKTVDDTELQSIQDAMKKKMASGQSFDGTDFLSMLGQQGDTKEGGKPANKKAIKAATGSKASGTDGKEGGKSAKQKKAGATGGSADGGGDDDENAEGKPGKDKAKSRGEKALALACGMVSKVNKRISDLARAEQFMKGQKSAASLITEVKENHTVLVTLLELVRKHTTCKPSAFDERQCITDGNACVRKLAAAKVLLSKAKPYQKGK